MRDYEVVYIFKPDLLADEVSGRLERYHQMLTGGDGSEITAVEHWGKRQLAYPIQNELNGYYVVAQFRCDPAHLPEYERLLKLEEQLLRYLVVLSEGELPTPLSALTEASDAPGAGTPAAKGDAKSADATPEAVTAPDTDEVPSDDAVEAATEEKVDAATEEKVEAATEEKVDAATEEKVDAATEEVV